jgi:hypothetical protein
MSIFFKQLVFIALAGMALGQQAHAQENGSTTNSHPVYLGFSVPFQGVGFYKLPSNKVNVWNLSPLSVEFGLWAQNALRLSVYTVYSSPAPKRMGEFEINLEFPHFFGNSRSPGPLFGLYAGPMLMVQLHDQDSEASLGGPGVCLGYKGHLGKRWWYRTGFYAAYHHYLWGPQRELLAITGGSKSGGLFMGLTIFEIGITL